MGIFQDFTNYFNSTTPGTVTPGFAGGNLTMGEGGNASYLNPNTGENASFNIFSDLSELARNNPSIAAAWGENYGFSPSAAPGTGPELFQPDLFPISTSTQQSSGTGSSTNRSGLADWARTQFLPQVQGAIDQMPNSINNIMQANFTPVMTQLMNDLANRNIINSSVASDSLGRGVTGLMGQAAQTQAGMPALLSQIAATLGNQSTGSSTSSSGSTGSSYNANPLAPYTAMMDFITNY